MASAPQCDCGLCASCKHRKRLRDYYHRTHHPGVRQAQMSFEAWSAARLKKMREMWARENLDK